ncbi:MAG: DUF1579 family protein [Planctomycetota bacterium]
MQKSILLGSTAVATLCATLSLMAQETEEASAPSAEALARMAPGPMHEKLEPLVGNFTMNGKWRMAPDAPWQEFAAAIERRWIMDERFVEERVTGEIMGQAFEGRGIMGYDNTRAEFTMVWIENVSTGTWFTTGRLVDGKLVFEGQNSDAMTGEKNRWSKSVLDLGADRHVFQGYGRDASGKEFLNAEMIETRE